MRLDTLLINGDHLKRAQRSSCFFFVRASPISQAANAHFYYSFSLSRFFSAVWRSLGSCCCDSLAEVRVGCVPPLHVFFAVKKNCEHADFRKGSTLLDSEGPFLRDEASKELANGRRMGNINFKSTVNDGE